jgi:peroxiredoxin
MELLRDRRTELEEAGVRPLGISRDSAWTHIAWAQALDFDFGLLSDWNGDATRGFGVAHDVRGMKDVSERSAFIVDEEGKVRGAWRYESGQVPDFDELLSAVRAL